MLSNRNVSIDSLRSIAVFLVILIHVYDPFLNESLKNSSQGYIYFISNIVISFSSISVPLFVMISGYFLLDKQETLSVFLEKELEKHLFLLFFGVFCSYLGDILNGGGFDYKGALKSMILGYPFYHLWYLYMILGLYFVTPFINIILLTVQLRTLKKLLFCLFVFGMINSIYEYYTGFEAFFITWFLNYLGYYITGYYLKQKNIFSNLSINVFCFVLPTIMTIILNYYLINYYHVDYFLDYLSPFIIVASVSFFGFIIKLKIKESVFSKISKFSFGIYLVHPFLLHMIRYLSKDFKYFNDPLHNFGLSIILMLSSIFFVKLILKIPILRTIV